MNNTDKKLYRVRSEYLANGLSFLGFRYRKFGYGKDTIFTFEDTEELRRVVDTLLALKKEINDNK